MSRTATLKRLYIVLFGCALQMASAQPPCAKPLILESFNQPSDESKLPDGWWAEGGESVGIEGGRLRVRANPTDTAFATNRSAGACTVWCPQAITGDVRIAFDACVIASEPEVCNINFFFLYSDPAGLALHDTRDKRRDGAYTDYHGLNGYILTFLADYPKARHYHPDGTAKARLRLRRCPDFQLLQETRDHHCTTGTVYHIEIVKNHGHITCAIDGQIYLNFIDKSPHTEGLIGFRTFRSDLWFDNLKVTACFEEDTLP